MVGALAGAFAGLAAGVGLAVMAPPTAVHAVAQAGGALALAGTLAGLYAAVGVILGAALAAVLAATDPTVDALARERMRRPRAAAKLYALLAAPLVAVLWALWLASTWARTWPARGWLGAALGVVLCVVVYYALWGLLETAERIDRAARQGQGRIGPALLAALGLGGAGAALRFVDAGVSPFAFSSETEQVLRLLVALGSVGLWMLAVLAGSKAARAGERRWGRLAAPRGALAVAIVAFTVGAFALSHLQRPEALARRELLRGGDPLIGRVAVGDE